MGIKEINPSAQSVLKWGSLRELWDKTPVFRCVIKCTVCWCKLTGCHGPALLLQLFALCIQSFTSLPFSCFNEKPPSCLLCEEYSTYFHVLFSNMLLMLETRYWSVNHGLVQYMPPVMSRSSYIQYWLFVLEQFVRLSQARSSGPDCGWLECGHMGNNLLVFTVGKHTSSPGRRRSTVIQSCSVIATVLLYSNSVAEKSAWSACALFVV